MKIFGLNLFAKRAPAGASPVGGNGGWWPIVREPFSGAWQKNVEWRASDVLGYSPVYACVSRISQDIGKLRTMLVREGDDGIWREVQNPAFSPVLRKPNSYQTAIQFREWWMTSKLSSGNAYVLKQRDNRNVVTSLHLMDASRAAPLVAPDGGVYYRFGKDPLARVSEDDFVVPASEVIHDRMNCLFHPLVGVSPLYAAGMAAAQGMAIQKDQASFATSGSVPMGFLTTAQRISDEVAQRIRDHFNTSYSGENRKNVAVLGDGLKFEPARMDAKNAEVVAQFKLTGEAICSAFHVPAYMVGIGDPPAYNNIEALNQQYYSQCLQSHIEAMELCLDEGLGLIEAGYGTELDLDALMRMDTASKIEALAKGVGGGMIAPNEGRARLNLPPVEGGDAPYLQQQNYSLEALARRDEQPAPSDTPPALQEPSIEPTKMLAALLRTKRLEDFAHA